MPRDPYAPPSARLADPPEPQHLIPKPRQVDWAVALLWLSFPLGFPSLYWQLERARSVEERVFLLVVAVPLVLFTALVNMKISAGRNWARIAFVFLLVFGLVLSFLPDERSPGTEAIESALNALTTVLELVSAYLLFSWPGALWFRPRS